MSVFIGAGAGFAGDRTDAAGPVVAALAQMDGPRFLVFETLAERTLALAQVERQRDASRGYNPALDAWVARTECLDGLGQHGARHRGQGRQGQSTSAALRAVSDAFKRQAKITHGFSSDRDGVLALRRQRQGSGRPLEKANAEFLLDALDCLAERRL